MLRGTFFACMAWQLLGAMAMAQAPLSVSSPRASQRLGTRLVDIYYDISGGVPPYSVTIEGSNDGGLTWTLPVTSVSGHIGGGVPAGKNRKVTWDAENDWAEQYSDMVKFRLSVTGGDPVRDGFILIPAGSFEMGDATGVGLAEELPVHTVQVSAFHMGIYEVTKTLWDEVRDWGRSNGYNDLFPGEGKASNHPLSSVYWYEMVKWCNARSEKEGLTPCYKVNDVVYRNGENPAVTCDWSADGYRLPTEAEWEYAARGGQVGQNFPWGDIINHSHANYYNRDFAYESPQNQGWHPEYSDGPYDGSNNFTAPVGSFAPNGYGLYDMAGNIGEFVWDWQGDYPAASQTNPRGPATGTYRVVRGGSWLNSAFSNRVSYRGRERPNFYFFDYGFRLARSAAP